MEENMVYINEETLNCSQSVFYAICKSRNKKVTYDMLCMLNAINAGFGTGGICSALIGALCAIGLFIDEYEIKSLRLIFLLDFKEKFGTVNCCELSSENCSCDDIIDFCINWVNSKIPLN